MARTPSPALAVATLALVVAIGGTAWAAALPRNSVGTAQLKRNAVTGAKVKNASLTGADIDLARLGTVPRAARAANAATVGGIELRRLHFRASPSSADALIFEAAGVSVRAQCLAASVLSIDVATSVDHTTFNGFWVGTDLGPPGGVVAPDLLVADGFVNFLAEAGSFAGGMHVALPDGTDIAIDWQSAPNPGGEAACLFTGVATITRA